MVDFINKIDAVFGGIFLVVLLFGCGLFFTFAPVAHSLDTSSELLN